MTEPEETHDESDRTDPILAPPTANPARVRMPPGGAGQQGDDPEPAESDRRREEG
ncbi:hypothetical protein ACGFIR_15700 [Micromonospora sp. NPDC049051]|uniref:hypothetical protein n=1 Tax=unclassified Micromonospora TaxID=2617518 RepID=UPI00371B1DB9